MVNVKGVMYLHDLIDSYVLKNEFILFIRPLHERRSYTNVNRFSFTLVRYISIWRAQPPRALLISQLLLLFKSNVCSCYAY